MDFEYEEKLNRRIAELVDKNATLAEAAMESFRETASVKAERDEIQRRLDAVVDSLKPVAIKWAKASMDSPEYHAWCLVVPLYGAALAIAEGRTE